MVRAKVLANSLFLVGDPLVNIGSSLLKIVTSPLNMGISWDIDGIPSDTLTLWLWKPWPIQFCDLPYGKKKRKEFPDRTFVITRG